MFDMEISTLVMAGFGLIALSSLIAPLRWRSARRNIQKLRKPVADAAMAEALLRDSYDQDGHRRAVDREEAWHSEAARGYDGRG